MWVTRYFEGDLEDGSEVVDVFILRLEGGCIVGGIVVVYICGYLVVDLFCYGVVVRFAVFLFFVIFGS